MPNKYTNPNKILLSISTLASLILATCTVASFVAQPAAAQLYSIPTTNHQTQACDTAGSASPISASCNGTTNHNVSNSPIKPVRHECPSDTPFTFNLVGTTCIGVTVVRSITFGGVASFCEDQLHGQVEATPRAVGLPFTAQCTIPAIAI